MDLNNAKGYIVIKGLMSAKDRKPFDFQQQSWQHIINGKSGLVNAPTGYGKTFSVFFGAIIQFINEHPDNYQTKRNNGLQLLWVTPLRALAKDIGRAMEQEIGSLQMQWKVGIRNGDTPTSERNRQTTRMPEILIITPESLHLLIAMKDNQRFFQTLRIIAVDEWHELLGSKRGVQAELAVSYIVNCKRSIPQPVQVWGISATIGNLDEAKEVLLSPVITDTSEAVVVKADLTTTIIDNKKTAISNRNSQKSARNITGKLIAVHSIIPDEIEQYPWAGHLGIKLAHKLVPIIEQSNTTLIFINTRGMSERWYQTLLDIAPQLAGAIALHHGSIEQELRTWVEEALHTQTLKAVVCTASLDLGVDFRPVDTVVQVGSPKGVARFLQRAGRAGHQPGEISHIYFLPTHALELVEATALKAAIAAGLVESREPMLLCFDVLVQWLCTLAVGDGFNADEILSQVKSTYCFREMTMDEWDQLLLHITEGGNALQQYDEFKKVEIINSVYKIRNRRIALRHRLHIGTIVSDAMLRVKFLSGGYVGVIEEYFITRLEPGDVFTLAGKNLELVQIKDMNVFVRKSNSKKSIVPSWMGGRMSLTANLGAVLRQTFSLAATPAGSSPEDQPVELRALKPLFDLQKELSHIPANNELLIEHIEDKEGFHLMVYPFEGRQVHEAMSAILAYRISQVTPISFSIAMNDYGFELLSDQPIPVDDSNAYELFTDDNLLADMQRSTNSTEMAMRKFRDIATIGGLIFQGMPGEHKKARHLQSSASLLFKVFRDYDPGNILMKQAYNEVFEQQMEEVRLRNALQRIQGNPIVITFPERYTPLSFPIIVDGLSRMNLSSEKLEDRIRRMQLQADK